MEILSSPTSRRRYFAVAAIAATALAGHASTSYSSENFHVSCDSGQGRADLAENGMVEFTVHGTEADDIATVQVRRSEEGVSVAVTGDVTGPPQRLEADGFTKPTPIVDGPELSAFGAGGAWVIDVHEDSVAIQGTCEGM